MTPRSLGNKDPVRSHVRELGSVPGHRRRSNVGECSSHRKKRHKWWSASPREKTLAVFVVLILTFNVWGFGGTSWWVPTVVTFYAGLGSLIWVLLPLPWHWDFARGAVQASAVQNAQRLLRFPLFWLGLLLLSYMSISIFNQSATFRTDGQYMWLEPLNYISWLPAGLDTPFEDMNALRTVMLYAGPWMFFCALCIGMQQRRSFMIILYSIVLNAVPLALYGGWFRSQDYHSGVMDIYGLVNFQIFGFPYIWTVRPFGPILGPNIAAAFLNMAVAINLALLAMTIQSRREAAKRYLPLCFLGLSLLIIIGGVIFSASKAGILILSGLLILSSLVVCYHIIRGLRNKWVAIAVASMFLLLLGLGMNLTYHNFDRILPKYSAMRVGDLDNLIGTGSVSSRLLYYQRTWAMFLDEPWTGHGTGTYRYKIPRYLSVQTGDVSGDHASIGRLNQAHNDYLQFISELGMIGGALLLAGMLVAVCTVLRLSDSVEWFLSIGGVAILLHAVVDFPFVASLNCLILACLSGFILRSRNRMAEVEAS